MPSRASVALRRKQAIETANETLAVIADHLGIDLPPVAASGASSRVPELREMEQTEQLAGALHAIATAIQAAGDPLSEEAESFDIDVVAAYEAYITDERATGPDEQFAFQDAVLGAFGVSMDVADDVEADVAETVEPDAAEPDETPEPEAPAEAKPAKAAAKAKS